MGMKMGADQLRKVHEMLGEPFDPSEDDFQTEVIDLARSLGWRVAHFRKVRIQRPDGSVYWQTPVQADGAGWPDLVLCSGRRLIFAELKSKKGAPTSAQYRWLDDLKGSGAEVYVWRPKDIQEIKRVLGELL